MHEFGTHERNGKILVHFFNDDRSLRRERLTSITQIAIGQIKAGQKRFPDWIWFIELDSGDLIGARAPKRDEHDGDIVLCDTTPAFVIDCVDDVDDIDSRTLESVETFELCGSNKREYFDEDDDVEVQSSDRVLVTIDYIKGVATWVIVPEGGTPSNCVPQEDDYDGVVKWLVEHDYDSPELIQARKNQLGMA